MESYIIIIHMIAAVAIVGLVLIQHGKGADMGASFGSGASQTVFGSVGSGNFLTKSTTVLAILFFATSLGLAVIAKQRAELNVQDNSLIEDISLLTTDLPSELVEDIFPVIEAGQESDIPVGNSTGDDIPVLETD